MIGLSDEFAVANGAEIQCGLTLTEAAHRNKIEAKLIPMSRLAGTLSQIQSDGR